MKVKYFITTLAISILTLSGILLLLPKKAAAQNQQNNITYERINPDNFLYNAKRLVEKIELNVIYQGDSKKKFMTKLLDKRFKELVYINGKDKKDFIEPTTSRYNSTIGVILAEPNKDSDLKANAAKYLQVLPTLRDKYAANSAYWLLIQQTIDSTKRAL